MQIPSLIFGWSLAIFVAAVELILLVLILTGRINLAGLLTEENGKASLSRFQFLLFTFVVATSFFLIVVGSEPPKFPSEIPSEIFVLLGISGGSYVISKGIQKNYEIEVQKLGEPTTGQESMQPEP